MKRETRARTINELTREEILKKLNEHPQLIKHLNTQDVEICKIALKKNPNVICLIREQTEELCLFAIEQNPESFVYVRNRTDKVIERALALDSKNIYYLCQKDFDRYSVQSNEG